MRQVVDLLFAPSMRLMGRLRFAQKLGLIGANFAVAIAILAYLLLTEIGHQISAAESERLALAPLDTTHELMDAIQQHQDLNARQLGGDKGLDGDLAAAAKRVDAALTAWGDWGKGAGARF